MSWIEKLRQTYENNKGSIGDRNDKVPLLPVCHTIQNAHVQITVDRAGNFVRANIVEKAEAPTIVPATEESAGRTGSKPAGHPLSDKLQYVASDFLKFGGRVTSGFAKQPGEPCKTYLRQLSDWCASPFKHSKVCAVLAYVTKGHVIADLVKAGILPIDSHGKLVKARPGRIESPPQIFRVLSSNLIPEDSFIRWKVEVPGDPQADLSTDSTVWKSWADYYGTRGAPSGLCYVTGKLEPLATNNPKRIRHPADGGKLISSNDTSGFTFLGRFTSAQEAAGVGFEVTQKAHNALRWLIERQGKRNGDQAIVAWSVCGVEVPDPLADTLTLLSGSQNGVNTKRSKYTAQEVGTQLSKLIAGYSVKLGPTDDVVVIALDSANLGRIAIRFYRELTGSEFLERVMSWHAPDSGCTWEQNLGKDRVFVGAPAPRDIAAAAYGRRLDEKLRNATTERLLPSIVDGASVPRDLVDSCVHRACNRAGSEHWDWEKTLGIACALYKYTNKERRYTMALERDRSTRDYLYGRLLALAEHLEGRALKVAGENRETNAARLMQRFADRPHSTWLTIETSLNPYKARLQSKRPGFLVNVMKEMDEVFSRFESDAFLSDKRLSGEFLLGYHCQRAALWEKPSDADEDDEDNNIAQLN